MKRGIERAVTAVALGFVVWFYHWTVEANAGFDDGGDADYYRLLVRGWRKGQLALDKAPAPELLALADPYDPAQNAAHRLPDASYYRGKYYLYFGAAPALTLMLPYTLVTGREMGTGTAVFVFCTTAFLAASGVWLALRRRYFPGSGMLIAPAGVLALGFGTHLLALAQRPSFWELPIAAGIAFTILALAAIYRAIHGPHPVRAMVAAGLFLGLAVASRPTCLFAVPLLLAPVMLAWRTRREPGSPTWWQLMLGAAIPLGVCGLAIMAHNFARFENPLEFGQHYQLSGAYEGKLVHFSPRFVPHNIAVYFFQPVTWTWTFPFVSAPARQVDLAGYFGTEEVCGLAVTFAFVWFALGLPLAWRNRPREERRAFSATLLAIAGYVVPVAILLLAYFSTTARYQADFAVGVALLALCGLLAWERAVRNRVGLAAVRMLAVGGCGATVVMGALVSFDYHGRAMGRTRPELWARLEERAQSALGNAGLWFGAFDGARVLKVRFKPQPTGTVETFWRAADPQRGERILIEHTGPRLIRFGYVRGDTPAQWGRPLTWERGHTHTVEVQLPSLHRPPRGAWRGLRRGVEYRERTSVAVWFSGGQALHAIVDPWPARAVSGGAVGSDFSGEVRSTGRRLPRPEDLRDGREMPAASGLRETLRLRIILPDALDPAGEPLFAAGAHYGSDIVFLRPAENGFRVAVEHYGAAAVQSGVLPFTGAPLTLEIRLPAFGDGGAGFGGEATGEVAVWIDGAEVLRERQPGYGFSPGRETIGRNPFGTTCAPAFRGWVLEAQWRGASRQRVMTERASSR